MAADLDGACCGRSDNLTPTWPGRVETLLTYRAWIPNSEVNISSSWSSPRHSKLYCMKTVQALGLNGIFNAPVQIDEIIE
jgi:hypothetical protein